MIDEAADSCAALRQQLDQLRGMIGRGGLKHTSRRQIVRQYKGALDAMVKGLAELEAALRAARDAGQDEELPV